MTGRVDSALYKNIKPGGDREWYCIRPPRGRRILMIDGPAGVGLVDSGQPDDGQIGITSEGLFLPRSLAATLAQDGVVCLLTVTAARDLFSGEAPYGSPRFKYLFMVDRFNRLAAVDEAPQDDGRSLVESFTKRFSMSCRVLVEQWARARHDAEVFCRVPRQCPGEAS